MFANFSSAEGSAISFPYMMAIALMGGTRASAVCTQGFATKLINIIEINCEAPKRTVLDAFKYFSPSKITRDIRTDRRTDSRTDGQNLLCRCDGASKKQKEEHFQQSFFWMEEDGKNEKVKRGRRTEV